MTKKHPKKKTKKYELKFPKDFMWGTGTSAHQVEGQNIFNDWWAWEQKGKILNRQISGDATNQYDLYKRDFDLMKTMHHNTHRFSIEWSRIERTEGEFNKYEIKHYRNVLKYMRSIGLKPMVTLFHFTLPHWFAEQGGFLHPQGRKIFNRYVEKVVSELGDLVEYWVTINEPYVFADFGYLEGMWPPGQKNIYHFLKILRILLHAHIDTYQSIKVIYRKKKWPDCQIGFAKSFVWFEKYKDKGIMSELVTRFYRYMFNKSYFRPFYSGHFPLVLGLGEIHEAKESIDFIGMNYYFRRRCKFSPFLLPRHVCQHEPHGHETTLFNWEVYPEGLYQLSKLIYQKVKKPIFITENGISTLDDTQRISYIVRHLDAINRAMADGVDIKGYYYWTFVDNFEWTEGYTQPFGLIAMNHRTFDRIPKPSADVFSEICRTGKVTDHMIRKYAKSVQDKILT